MVLFAFMVWY